MGWNMTRAQSLHITCTVNDLRLALRKSNFEIFKTWFERWSAKYNKQTTCTKNTSQASD